jgi:hypothetical protein
MFYSINDYYNDYNHRTYKYQFLLFNHIIKIKIDIYLFCVSSIMDIEYKSFKYGARTKFK